MTTKSDVVVALGAERCGILDCQEFPSGYYIDPHPQVRMRRPYCEAHHQLSWVHSYPTRIPPQFIRYAATRKDDP